jgi:hypothetical protein
MLDMGSTEDAEKQSWHYWPGILVHTKQRSRSIVVVKKQISRRYFSGFYCISSTDIVKHVQRDVSSVCPCGTNS